ncbi:MAG TPA: ImmA/IrrE family metallo-endopeptidase, partial [Acidimicrobiales bacterium]|nr:ImmA/IrrE family metallo-endopeptidase [Acidimicrobiales bacterium]
TDVADHFGFRIARVQDLPPSTRSITDVRSRVVYVPQRNATGGQRSSRSVIAQTLGHFALGHSEPVDFEGYVRQRVEANYFAGALLAPEGAVVKVLGDAKARDDISVEDLSESFYISYEMAAHRLTNLITRHFQIPIHFQRSDPEGLLWKAYENDGVLLPCDVDGTIEGQRLCRWWSSRQAFESEDSYALHYQYTETITGTFWCVTHIDIDRERGDAITVGTTEEAARWFRGSDTTRRARSTCPDPACCRQPAPDAVDRWEGVAWPSARDHSHFVSGLPTDTVVFSPHPGVALTDVFSFLDRHAAR